TILIRRAVKLISHAKVEREGWSKLPIILEEHRPIVLMGPRQLSGVVEETVPLRVLRVVNVVVHLRVVYRTGKEIKQAVCRGLIALHETRESRGDESSIRVVSGAA